MAQGVHRGFPDGSAGKKSTCNAGDLGSISGLGRSPGEGNSYLFLDSGQEISMGCIVHGIAKSQTQLSNFTFTFTLCKRVEGFSPQRLSSSRQSYNVQFSSVRLFSHVQLFVTSWTSARQASLSITNSQSLPKLMSIELVMPYNHLILCHPLLLLPSIFPSQGLFQ